jgi:hypothetical protein
MRDAAFGRDSNAGKDILAMNHMHTSQNENARHLHHSRPNGDQPRPEARHSIEPGDTQQPIEGDKQRRMRKAANTCVRLPLPGDEARAGAVLLGRQEGVSKMEGKYETKPPNSIRKSSYDQTRLRKTRKTSSSHHHWKSKFKLFETQVSRMFCGRTQTRHCARPRATANTRPD